ncbi:CMGC/CDK/CDK8 protein kinase [Saprolegnia diclina VS20]|uniref:Cyclin-dependent kinase 2 homolog n=1 Tax=Saprolegnia diclina (strain VS20) TaxID=1156394 RepID=T0RZT5_SAPDV|nr:CMGC/CDK/CDK8 protein kinase [Saprolegnia diclina VS20]EQC35947.1 CMGC/CDK/CDK8 protein kinase [Saprolegnia diclina VS20]|eukprot:XP_008610709.1 CMGC/CDK/CDK8 protein kinase [Saprolegnia diclina VS20]
MRRHSLYQQRVKLTDKYKLIGKIGEGTYGLVYKAELQARDSRMDDDEQSFAVKMIKSHKEGKNDVVLSIATVREIKILREMHHDNVVHLHDVHVDPRGTSLALVFDYADHDLRDIIIQSKQKPLSEYTKKSFMHQILKGVKYMHDNWVMHRDMKPQNILVVGHGRRRGQVKLADFGLARIYKDPIKALTDVERVVVTLWYRAPELLLGAKHYTKAVDMWAVGCIFAEILNTRELFCGKEAEGTNAPFQKDQCDKIFKIMGMPTPQTWDGLECLPEYENMMQMCKERDYGTTSKLHDFVKFGTGHSSVLLRDLISRMLHYDPEKRITAAEALTHDYFKCEPYPRDWALDEPNKEPIVFLKQKIEPITEDMLPNRKSPAHHDAKDDDEARRAMRPNGQVPPGMKRPEPPAGMVPPPNHSGRQWSGPPPPGYNANPVAKRPSGSLAPNPRSPKQRRR